LDPFTRDARALRLDEQMQVTVVRRAAFRPLAQEVAVARELGVVADAFRGVRLRIERRNRKRKERRLLAAGYEAGRERHELLGDLREVQRPGEVARVVTQDRELEEPVVFERAIAARLDDRGAGRLVVVVGAERIAMPALPAEPIDQP